HINVSGISVHGGCQMQVAATVVAVTMGAKPACLVLAQKRWVNGIRQAPDQDAFIPGFAMIRVSSKLRSFERGNHLPVGNIHLYGESIFGAGDPVQNGWVRG